MIKDNPLFLISKSTCPFCAMAKDILKNEKVKAVDIDSEYSTPEVANKK